MRFFKISISCLFASSNLKNLHIHMYVNGKMKPVETIPGLGGGG
jgi:hypothetical protein